MLSRRHVRLALAAVFVCGLVRPAFADGALGGLEAFGQLLNVVLVVFAVGIVVLLAIVIRPRSKRPAGERTENAVPPELPEARVRNERSRSAPKQ